MASKMGYYNVEEFTKQKRDEIKEIKVPPKANILAAADHIKKVFEGKKFIYAFMGGLEMLCLGYRREMPDLQVAYDDKDFHKIKSKLESDQRVRLPVGMNSLFPAKLLVRTGPAYKNEGCTQSGDIEVDLVPPGSHGTPPNSSLASNMVLLSLKTEGKLSSYKSLNMLYLVKSLVHYCRVRDLAWEPRRDILFLCQHYAEEVRSVRLQLDQKAVQQNFLGTAFFTRLPPEDQRRCYQILLGTEPPPTMAITPPPPIFGHKHSASDPNAPLKPRLSSHQSSPALNTQNSSGLLSPPLPGKPRAASSHLTVGRPQIPELSSTSDAGLRTPSELATGNREPRSRYRPVSAPNTRDGSPAVTHITAPKTSHIRQRSQPPSMSSHRLGTELAPVNHLQPPPQRGPVHSRQSNSMASHFNAGYSGPVPAYAFCQTPALNGTQQYQSHMIATEMSVTPILVNPGQHHMKSQLGLAGGLLPQQNHMSSVPITPRPVPPHERATRQTEQSAEVTSSKMATESIKMGGFYVVNPDREDIPQSTPIIELPHTQSSSLPVELDAVSQLGRFIAELSAERSTPAPQRNLEQKPYSHQDQKASKKGPDTISHLAPKAQDSSVSPPTSTIPTKEHQDMFIRPLNPRTISAPGAVLPVSLMAGGTSLHQRTPNNSSTTGTSQANAPISNASRYTRYYASMTQTPPSSNPDSPPATTSTSAYKAYQPTYSPPSSTSLPLIPSESSDTSTERRSRVTTSKHTDRKEEYDQNKRDASHDSHASGKSCDSRDLAAEYRKELTGMQGYDGQKR